LFVVVRDFPLHGIDYSNLIHIHVLNSQKIYSALLVSAIGAVAAADRHCEAVSEEADRHSGACSASTHSGNAGMTLILS